MGNIDSRTKQIRDTTIAMARDIWAWLGERNVALMAAAIAFFSTLSLAPLLAFAISVAGLFVAEAVVEEQLIATVAENFGEETADFLAGLLSAAFRLDGSGPILALVGLLITIFFASNLFYWLKLALNSIWDVKPENSLRSGMLAMVWNRMLAAVMVLLAAAVLALTMVTRLITADLPVWLTKRWPELAETVWIFWQSMGVDLLLVTALMMVAYKLLPDVSLTWRQVLPGALLVTVLFMIGTKVMEIYFSTDILSTAYGAAGSPVIMLSWVYYMSYIFFFGALFIRAYVRHVHLRME
jgi:membrane protein